ncbi:RHS repeat-associated core domain-containing protein [Pseudomonas sp. WHRI 8519]|uniref:RHS repeat-associated core domain-containing protein n=1 Tax=Pseudomonas TaxID=286 RepID=UPI0035565CEA
MNRGEKHVYTAYGFSATAQRARTALGFNGEHLLAHTSLYILGSGYRAFNPSLLRFYSADSLSPFGDGGINSYAYCSGDPVNQIDPTGHASFLYPAKAPKIQLPRRGPELKLPTHPTTLAPKHFSKASLQEMNYSANQYVFRISKSELDGAKLAIMSASSEATAATATKRFISLENRHHQIAEGLNRKITSRYTHVIQRMTVQNLYSPKLRVRFTSELLHLVRDGMDLEIPNAYDMRTIRPPY